MLLYRRFKGVMKKVGTILLVSAILFPMAAQDNGSTAKQEPQPITLTIEQAVEYANQNSRTLKAAQIDLEMKERASKYAWNVFIPTIKATGTLSRSNEFNSMYAEMLNPLYKAARMPVTLPTSYADEKSRWVGVGNLSASLNLSLALIQSIKATHVSYEAGQISWMQTVKKNELDVRKMFYGLLLAQERLDVQKATLENARQRARQAETNYRNGQVPELSLLQAQVTYENQRPEIEKLEQQLAQQLDTFAFLLGMPVGTKIKLEGKIEPSFLELTADDLLAKYSEKNEDIRLLEKNIELQKRNLSALDLSSYTPALVLSWNSQKTNNKIFVEDYMTDRDKWSEGGALSLTIAWTLSDMLPFSANRQKAKDLQDTIRKLEVKLDTLRQDNELTVKKTVDSLAQAKSAIESNRRNITLAQRSYNMTAAAYRAGTRELLDLRDAETQLNQAKLGVLNEEFNYMSYLLDLEYILNTQLIGGNK